MSIRMPAFQAMHVPDGIVDPQTTRLMRGFNARVSEYGVEVQKAVNTVIDRKHAPILIPATTIDAAHAVENVTAASASGIFNNLILQKTASTTSASLQNAVSYTGRGILNKCLVMEKTSAGTTAYNASLYITIDGNIVYGDTAVLTRQSQLRVVVGDLSIQGTDLFAVHPCPIGLPFNKTCLIQFASDGTKTTTVGWNIVKKL